MLLRSLFSSTCTYCLSFSPYIGIFFAVMFRTSNGLTLACSSHDLLTVCLRWLLRSYLNSSPVMSSSRRNQNVSHFLFCCNRRKSCTLSCILRRGALSLLCVAPGLLIEFVLSCKLSRDLFRGAVLDWFPFFFFHTLICFFVFVCICLRTAAHSFSLHTLSFLLYLLPQRTVRRLLLITVAAATAAITVISGHR